MDPNTKMEFRRCLNRISNQLSRQNVEDMKFVCKDHVPVARMEKVGLSSLDIFQALEERGKLSPTNTAFLVKVLVSIERSNLISELVCGGFASPNVLQQSQIQPTTDVESRGIQRPPRTSLPVQGPNRELLFNGMLLKIAQNLSARNVEALTYTLCDSMLGMSADRVSSATQLFQLLQQRQIVTPTNLQALYNELENIGRSDLSKRIDNYLGEIGRPPCSPGRDEDGVPVSGAHVTVVNHTMAAPTEETRFPPRAPHPPQGGPVPSQNHYNYQHQPHPQSMATTYTNQSYQTQTTAAPNQPHYQASGTYHMTEGGQPVSSPSDSTDTTSMSTVTETYMSAQISYSTEEASSSIDPASMRAQSGEHDHNVRPSFVPIQVYPITSKPGLSVEETRGQDVPLQSQPLALTFDTQEDDREAAAEGGEGVGREGEIIGGSRVSGVEIQDLQKQWSQTQELLLAKEQEQKRLQENLEKLQLFTNQIVQEKEGESVQYEVNKRELETALQVKIDEIEVLRSQVQGLQQKPRQVPEMNPEEFYPLNKNPHGICLIINNHHFYHDTDQTKAHPDRGGAEIDQYNLTQTFRYLRYKVEVHENLTSDQMTDTLMRMSQRDHSKYDSFVCCILSHGEHNIIHGANSEPVNVDDLTGVMKLSSSLRDKPKLFFIQSCRGDAEEVGFEKDNPGDSTFRSTIPRDADFFLGYATPLGKAAYRSRKHGSWYISELCKVFTQYGYHKSLSQMMRKVNSQVSNAFTKDGYKQCCEFVDRLRREVHFFHFIRSGRSKPAQ